MQVDQDGNVNVSRLEGRPHVTAGAGGFIDITANARQIVFSGYFTAAVWSWRLKGVNCESSKKARRANLHVRSSMSPSAVAAHAPISKTSPM